MNLRGGAEQAVLVLLKDVFGDLCCVRGAQRGWGAHQVTGLCLADLLCASAAEMEEPGQFSTETLRLM